MRPFLAVILLLLVAACQQAAPTLTDADRAEITAAIHAQADALVTAQNALDAEAFMAVMDTADMVWVNQAARYDSWAEVGQVVRSIFSGVDAMDSGWWDLNVTVLAPDAALSHGVWWGEQTSGAEVVRFDTVFWTALHRPSGEGRWVVTRVHQSWQDPTLMTRPDSASAP